MSTQHESTDRRTYTIVAPSTTAGEEQRSERQAGQCMAQETVGATVVLGGAGGVHVMRRVCPERDLTRGVSHFS
jgi:hypothetical protein